MGIGDNVDVEFESFGNFFGFGFYFSMSFLSFFLTLIHVCLIYKKLDGSVIYFMDSEGLFANSQSRAFDSELFSISALLSS